jgi:hypothetical protein
VTSKCESDLEMDPKNFIKAKPITIIDLYSLQSMLQMRLMPQKFEEARQMVSVWFGP